MLHNNSEVDLLTGTIPENIYALAAQIWWRQRGPFPGGHRPARQTPGPVQTTRTAQPTSNHLQGNIY